MTLASYITSIAQFDMTNTGTSISANMGAGVNVANCVPFFSLLLNGTGDDWDDICCDVSFTAGSPPTVTCTFSGNTGSINISMFVVEFDGTNVEVQCDTFEMTNAETTDSVDITAITDGKAFIVPTWWANAGDDDWDGAMIEASFTDTDTVYFERGKASGDIYGHFYVVEAQGSEFSVQTCNPDIAHEATVGTDDISAITTTQSMIIASSSNVYGSDNGRATAIRLYFVDSDTVAAERNYGYYILSVTAFIVTFAGGETIQHKVEEWGVPDVNISTEITEITEAQSILYCGHPFGIMEYAGAGSAHMEAGFVKLTFTDSDTVYAIRGDDDLLVAGTCNFQVIDFEASGAPTPTYSGRGVGRGIIRGVMR